MASSDKHIRMLVNLARSEPTLANWRQISEALAKLSMEDLPPVISALREPLKALPAKMRRENIYSSGAPWLTGLFDGVFDPRLELVGWADLSHNHDFKRFALYGKVNSLEGMYRVTLCFARALDPGFNPPDTVLSKQSEYTSAAGCGGGFDEEKRGDENQGMVWYDKIDESPSGIDPSTGYWRPYGLAGGYDLRIGRYERHTGYYTFSLSGPTPKVFELAHAWGILLRDGKATPDTATSALKYSREIFQLFEADRSSVPAKTRIKSPVELPAVAPAEEVSTMEYTAASTEKISPEIMSRIYQKIINPLSGTPCCPHCKSPNIAEIDGVYEFGLMQCGDCGYSQMCDIYQQGDWYV